MRAYEMFAAGLKKAEIARQLGVTKPTVGAWAKKDHWVERMETLVRGANEAADHAVGDTLARALARLKESAARRITELETLCGPSNHPSTRLKAIQLWLKMAGLERAMPDPVSPTDKPSLELLEDLTDNVG